MAHGGARAGAGRRKNGHNRLAAEAVANAQKGGEMPLDFLLRVMRDECADDMRRLDAAKAAAPYVHPKLQPVDKNGSTEQRHLLVATGVPRGD